MFGTIALPVFPFPTPCAWPGVPFGQAPHGVGRAPAIGVYFAPGYFPGVYFGGEYVGPTLFVATLTATPGDEEVLLEWSGLNGTEPYTATIYRSTSPGVDPDGGATLVVADEATGSHTDTGLTNDTTYYYLAIVEDSSGRTARSFETSATPESDFDPLALSDRVGVWDSLAGLYQVADGTSPATTHGQDVGSWMSLDGSDHLLTATVGTNNPTLAITGTTPVVHFGGGASGTTRKRLQKNLSSTNPSGFTFHFLMQAQNANSTVLASFNSSGNNPWFCNRSTGSNEVRIANGAAVARDIIPFLQWERWVHITYRINGSTGVGRIYIDGLPIYEHLDVGSNWTRTAIVLGSAYAVSETVQRMAHASVFDAVQTDAEILGYFNWLRNRFPELLGVPGNLIVFHGSSSVRCAHLGAIAQDHCLARGAWLTLDTPRPQFLVAGSEGGKNVQDLTANFDTFVRPHLERATGKKVLACVSAVSNSIAVQGRTPAQAYSDLVAYCSAVKAAIPTVKLVVQTVTPRNSMTNAQRAEINGYITGGVGVDGFDYVADVASDTLIGEDGDNTNTTYYLADQLHLNYLGNQVADNYYEAPFEAALA